MLNFVIINEVHTKLKSINYVGKPDIPLKNLDEDGKQKKVIHYMLAVTEVRLIQLMLQIHSFYNDYFNNEYLTVLKLFFLVQFFVVGLNSF